MIHRSRTVIQNIFLENDTDNCHDSGGGISGRTTTRMDSNQRLTTSKEESCKVVDDVDVVDVDGDSNNNGNRFLPEMVRMRCGTYPTTTTPTTMEEDGTTSSSLLSSSVEIHLEIDIRLVRHPTGGTDSSSRSRSLCDLQLSCSPTIEPSSSSSSCKMEVHTCSAIVPTLHIGDCVTIMACVTVCGITPYNDDEDEDRNRKVFGLGIAILWRNYHNGSGGSSCSSSSSDGGGTKGYKGTLLGSIHFPLETLLLDQHPRYCYDEDDDENGDDEMEENGLLHTIDFMVPQQATLTTTLLPPLPPTKSSSSSTTPAVVEMNTTSNAIFDYRKPRILTIDISKSNTPTPTTATTNLNNSRRRKHEDDDYDVVERLWDRRLKGLITSVHRGRIGRIDVHHDTGGEKDGGRQYVRLAVFASSPEHRAGLVELVLKCLPETVHLVETSSSSDTNTTTNNYMTRSLVTAVTNEINIMERHSSLLPTINTNDDDDEDFVKKKKKKKKTKSSKKKLTSACLAEMVESQYVTDELAARLMDANGNNNF